MGSAPHRSGPPITNPSFAASLAAAAVAGPDRAAAFEHLLRPLLFPLLRYLRSQVGDAADDLVDEVLLAVWAHLDRFQGSESKFRSWIFTIAHHQVVDLYRRRRDDQPLDRAASHQAVDDTEAEAISRVTESELRAVLAGLAPLQREVLVMRVIDDLSIEQTAALLGRTPGAIKALQHRAIEAARLKIQGSSEA